MTTQTETPKWFVVRSATQQEKRALTSLREAGYTVYMPARTVLARHARTEEVKHRPLFVGYMFLLDPGEKGFYAIKGLDGVSGLINVNGSPAQVPHAAVAAFFFAQLCGAFDETLTAKPGPWRPKKGDKAIATVGPYATLALEVVRLEKKDRVRVLYELFGRKGETTLPIAQLQAA